MDHLTAVTIIVKHIYTVLSIAIDNGPIGSMFEISVLDQQFKLSKLNWTEEFNWKNRRFIKKKKKLWYNV